MANLAIITFGILFFVLAGLGFITLNSVWDESSYGTQFANSTIPEIYELCGSTMGHLVKSFSTNAVQVCQDYKYLTFGIYGFGLDDLYFL